MIIVSCFPYVHLDIVLSGKLESPLVLNLMYILFGLIDKQMEVLIQDVNIFKSSS